MHLPHEDFDGLWLDGGDLARHQVGPQDSPLCLCLVAARHQLRGCACRGALPGKRGELLDLARRIEEVPELAALGELNRTLLEFGAQVIHGQQAYEPCAARVATAVTRRFTTDVGTGAPTFSVSTSAWMSGPVMNAKVR